MKNLILGLTLITTLPVFGQTFEAQGPDRVTELVNWGNKHCEKKVIVFPAIDEIKLNGTHLSFRFTLEHIKGSGANKPFSPQILIRIPEGRIITFLKLPPQTKNTIIKVETTLDKEAAEALFAIDYGLSVVANAAECGVDHKSYAFIPDEKIVRIK